MRITATRSADAAGAAAVEFVLVLTFILIPLIAVGLDLGLATFVRQQATAAARDGARAAIVSYGSADVIGSTDHTRVINAVRARMVFPPSSITVRCTGPDTVSAGPSTITCASAVPDRDRVEVTVTIPQRRLMGLVSLGDQTRSAAQVVVTKG